MSGYATSMGASDESTITVLGHDLAGELMGQVGFAEHGLTPSAIAARLTLTGAPESVPGAIAAGLLGGGSRFLGVTEDAGRFLAETLAGAAEPPCDDAAFDAL